MRLKITLLNSDATLNSFKQISQLKLERGESLDVIFQLIDADKGIRYIPEAGASVLVSIPRTTSVIADLATNQRTYEDNTVSRAAVPAFAEDRSIWRMPLSEQDTMKLVSSSIRVVVTESSGKKIAVLNQAVQVLSVPS